MERTVYCGLVTKDLIGSEVTLKGWVQKRRDLGGLLFIDLRDREGIVQVTFNDETDHDAWKVADSLRNEYVVEIQGTVIKRVEDTINPDMQTGEVEVEAHTVTILNKAKTTPFPIEDNVNVADNMRLQYRYLDLRRPKMQDNLRLRHQVTQEVRNYLNDTGFIDIETPYLTKSTPEGARDYLVPSRVHPGYFYALPQSPQIFKQLLMSSGFDRYYQIVRCFRDEDLRGDRQPEFTQIDIETSFIDADEIQTLIEGLIQNVMKEVKGIDIELPIERMTYDTAMNVYGSDKPDLRFDMPLIDVNDTVKDSEFKVFTSTIEDGGTVKALNAKGAADSYSRKQIDELAEFVGIYGAKGLAWLKVKDGEFSGPIAKFFNEEELRHQLIETTDAEEGDLLLFVASKPSVVNESLGALRNKLGKELELIDEAIFRFVWIVDWPLLEYDEESDRYKAAHHPFTMPQAKDLDKLATEPENVKANAYDIVLNGYEIGGGSLRIYQREVQNQMFEALGFTKEEAESQFGFLLDAMDYGFPPHGGIAFGLDRLVMILAGEDNIREVIAFPKNSRAADPLSDSPSAVSTQQLKELGLNLEDSKNEEA